MAEDMKKKNQRNNQWKKSNATPVTLTLFHSTDADILEAINGVEPRATILKRLIRLGIYAKEHNLIAEDIMRQIVE